jgi:transposase-like protein
LRRQGTKAFPGKGKKTNVSPEKLELDRLRRENKQLRDERDILKKTLVFLAAEEAKNSNAFTNNEENTP